MRDEREAGHFFDPGPIFSAGDGTGHDGENVTVGQDHETGAKGGNDLVHQPVGEVGGVIERHRDGAERVAPFRILDALPGQCRPRHSGIEHGMAVLFEPYPQASDLRGPAD
jgi:hypothetical protein